MSPPLRVVEMARRSETGRVRDHNEDRDLAAPPVLVVADGMGGAKAGEVAAQEAVKAVSALGARPSRPQLRAGVLAANRAIRRLAADDPARSGMGTTLTAALLEGERATLVHVGDSRAYLWRSGVLSQITEDHSMVAEMVREGSLAPEDAERHPNRNIITRALGAEPHVELDELELEVRGGDVLLLCTDGLSAQVSDEEIERVIAEAASLDDAADALVRAADEAGGADNITIVLARLGGDEAPAEEESTDPDATSELPVIEVVGSEQDELPATEVRRLAPPPPLGVEKSAPRPRVLEEVRRRRPRLRIVAIAALAIVVIGGAAAAWIGSRTYFVDAGSDGTVEVFHGLPVDLAGAKLFWRWGDTGLVAGEVRKADPGALGRTARGQGDAVHRAVALVWRDGLPDVPSMVAPPAAPRPGR